MWCGSVGSEIQALDYFGKAAKQGVTLQTIIKINLPIEDTAKKEKNMSPENRKKELIAWWKVIQNFILMAKKMNTAL